MAVGFGKGPRPFVRNAVAVGGQRQPDLDNLVIGSIAASVPIQTKRAAGKK
jgi:hypothetical protein